METAQSSSISNRFEIQSYTVRRGAIDYGRDYEVRMTALIALRCISSNLEEAGIAFNVGGCSDFDDVVVYKKMKGSNAASISLVQLKHQIQPKYIQSEDFLKEKGNFSLGKYSKGFDEVMENDFNVLKKMFNDNNINCNNVDLVLYTNRAVDILGMTPKPCQFLKLHQQIHYLNTNLDHCNIHTFNIDHEQMQGYPKQFLKRLFLFTCQVDVKSVNQLILVEIQKIVPNISSHIIDNFIKFITSWAKGELGGFHVLTRTRIIDELTILLLDSHISKFITLTDHVAIEAKDENFNQIIKNFDVILISHFDRSVIEYLRSCLNWCLNKVKVNGIKMFSQLKEKQFDQLCDRFPALSLICKNKVTDGTILFCDIYKALWQLGCVALSCIVDNEEEYSYVYRTLSHLHSNNKYIILSETLNLSKISVFDKFKVLCNLDDLNTQLSNVILDQEVKFQNRGPFTFRSIIKDIPNIQALITTNDIICVLNGTFCLGNFLPCLPEVYIPRTLPKVILSFDVFSIKNQIFVVACKEKRSFQNCIKSNLNCLLFDTSNEILEDDLRSNKCLIILMQCDSNFSSSTKLLNRDTHYVKFHDQQRQIQWLKSSGDVNPLRSKVKDIFGSTFYFSLEHLANTSSSDITCEFPNTLNVISAGPGMGKSVAMDIIALHAPVDRWVLRIDLNRHLDYFHNLNWSCNTPESHLKYFGTALLKQQNRKSELNIKVLSHFLNSKNILLLFDGFDEIAPAYKDCVTEIIHNIREGEFAMWITTRPVLKSHVERQFNCISYTLNSFTSKNQTDFILKYFLNHIKEIDECVIRKINNYVMQLLELAEANLGSNILILMGIPLQTRILAEVHLEDLKNYIVFDKPISRHNFDILNLYEKFVSLKQIEFISKFKGDEGKRIVKLSEEYHKLYGFKIIFQDKTATIFSAVNRLGHFARNLFGGSKSSFDISVEIDDKLCRFIDEVKDASNNVGFVILQDQINLSFLHRTFAEYYAAVWLAENIQNRNYKQFINKLVKPNYELVRNFFDRIIVKDLPLHTAVMNRNVAEVRDIVRSDTNSVNKRDILGRTPLYLLVTWSKKFPVKTFQRFINYNNIQQDKLFSNEAEIAKLLIEQTLPSLKSNPYNYAHNYYCLNMLNAFSANINQIGFSKNLLDGILYYCIENEFMNLLKVILGTYPTAKKLINNSSVTVDDDSYTFLQVAVLFQKLNVMDVMLQQIDRVRVRSIVKPFITCEYNKSTIIEMMQQDKTRLVEELLCGGVNINATSYGGETMLFNAVKSNKYHLINLLLNNCANIKLNNWTVLHYAAAVGQTDTIELLLSKILDHNVRDNNGNTASHIAALNGRNKTMELLLSREVDLNVRNNSGSTILHDAVAGGHNDTMEILLLKGIDLDVRDNDGNTVLHIAAMKGHNETIELLLLKGSDLNVRNNFGSTILHSAAAWGQNGTIEFLVSKGLNPDVRDNDGNTILHIAAFEGRNNIIEQLLLKGVDLNVRDNLGRTILHHAAIEGQNSTIELLLLKGLDLGVRDNNGDTVFHTAALNGQNKTIELILSRENNLDVRNKFGRTLLHHAADGGHNDTVELLVSKGLDLDVRDNGGNTALHISALKGQKKTVEHFLSKGVDIDVKDKLGRDILHQAAGGGHNDIIELLLAKGLDLDVRDNDGRTVLHTAALTGQNETLEKLFLKGMDLNVRDNFGRTILHCAVSEGQIDTIELLLLKGLDLNVRDSNGDSLVHFAALTGQNETLELLLSRGINVNVRNNINETPLSYAIRRGNNETVTFLRFRAADI